MHLQRGHSPASRSRRAAGSARSRRWLSRRRRHGNRLAGRGSCGVFPYRFGRRPGLWLDGGPRRRCGFALARTTGRNNRHNRGRLNRNRRRRRLGYLRRNGRRGGARRDFIWRSLPGLPFSGRGANHFGRLTVTQLDNRRFHRFHFRTRHLLHRHRRRGWRHNRCRWRRRQPEKNRINTQGLHRLRLRIRNEPAGECEQFTTDKHSQRFAWQIRHSKIPGANACYFRQPVGWRSEW